jgi:hypothetical protein
VNAFDRADESVVVALPMPRERIAAPTHLRSTLIASSLRAIRSRGLEGAYLKSIDPLWKDMLLESVAGVWLPIEAGLAHYFACDALPMGTPEQILIGREVGDRIHGTFLGTMIRTAKNAGVTPWSAFPYTLKLYERIFDGGACAVSRVGPKDARMEVVANPLFRFPYFRNAMRGVWQCAIELFCQKAYITEVARSDTSFKVKISWA